MSYSIVKAKKPKNALILQGDWEGGVANVALDMVQAGISVTKVVLNASDWIYNKRGIPCVDFDEPLEKFPPWLSSYVNENAIDCIIIYNQYRPYNKIGWELCRELSLECIVLELGLLRPDFCTIYTLKLNHFEYLSSEWQAITSAGNQINEPEIPQKLGRMRTMKKMKQFAASYVFYRTLRCLGRKYIHYQDQREQGFFHHFHALIKSGLLYQGRGRHERFNNIFATKWSGKFYLVPLQVHCDSQITERSEFESIESFIDLVIDSFKKFAPTSSKLIFKVHPMDRGYSDYHKKIKAINKLTAGNRIHYLDRIHLPTALDHCKGCITINSSVGLSALIHAKKTICLGQSAYNLDGLTFKGKLDDFWESEFSPEEESVENFLNLLKHTSQANGTLFQKLYSRTGHCKINWPPQFAHLFHPQNEPHS